MTVTCRTTDCPEIDIAKECDVWLAPGEDVYCGECGQPCEQEALAG